MTKLTELHFRYVGFKVYKGHFAIINKCIDDLMELDNGENLILSNDIFTCKVEYKDGVFEITCC